MNRKILLLFLIFSGISSAEKLNLLPLLPEKSVNPHFNIAFTGVKKGNITFTNSFAEADEILQAALVYLHPESPERNDQLVLNRLTLLLDTILGGWNNGRKKLNDMQFCFHANIAYLMLKTHKPDAIPTNRLTEWESGIRKNISAILSAKPDLYEKQIVGSLWLNGDVRLALGVYFGSLALNDSTSAAIAKSVLEDCMPRTLLGDGGTHYVGYANESPSYHGEATIRPYVWYYIFTGSEKIRNFIVATLKYIPLVNVPLGEGFKEWSTSPAWKPYYNRTTLKNEALAKAYLSGDGYNAGIGKGSQMPYLAYIFKSGVEEKSQPDNFMLYDRNILGPRGRYGNWGVVGTLRDPSVPEPELDETRYLMMDGTNTFVGAFTLNEAASSTTYPLNAAFQGAAPQVKYSSGKETDWQRGKKWAFLTGKDRNDAMTRSKHVYGLSTHYEVSKSRFAGINWFAQQQWVVTPDRVVGMMEIESNSTGNVYGLAQRIQLVSGRRNASGTKKSLVKISDNLFEYGDLKVKIHDKNYAGTVETFYHGVMNDTLDQYSSMLYLHDVKSGNDIPNSYQIGTRRFAIVEITNKDRQFSEQMERRTLSSGLEAFEFVESAGRKIGIIHNTGSNNMVLNNFITASPYSRTRLIKSWESNTMEILNATNNQTTLTPLTIPPYGHVLLINSNIEDDFTPGFESYETIYKNEISGISFPLPSKKFFEDIQYQNDELMITSSGLPIEIMVRVFDLSGKLNDSIKCQINSRISRIKLKTNTHISLIQLQKSTGEIFNLKIHR